MKELEETKCEVRNVINFELPLWDQADGADGQDEAATTDGSKESKFTLTSGGYLGTDCKYAWLSYGTRLAVVDVRYGNCISIQNFISKVTSVSTFPAEPGQVPLLLVGLDNNAIRIKDSVGHLCIFDCCSSTILTTIQVPAGVEKACIIHGGADWEEFHEKRPDTVLPGNTGLIFAALRNLQHVVIDIHRPLWEDAYLDGKSIVAKLEFVNDTPANIISNKSKKEPTHLAYDLMDREIEQYVGFDRDDFEATPLYDESLCSVLLSSTKIGCLITGCLGRVIIWQNDGSIGWISPPFDENAYVTHVALLEPSDDPRPFYYLWIACQNDSVDSSAVLRMYAMLFNKKHSDKSGESSLYFNLESEPSLKFELELEQGERIHSLLPVERENLRESADSCSRRGEDSLLLIGSDERMLLFDLNRWYKEQMPRTMAECRNPNSVMASYRTKYDELERKSGTISSSYIPRSLREFSTKGPTSPEELFYPNSLTLEWVELAVDSLTFWLARGAQSELLREITIAGPIVLVKPSETYRRCLTVGLVPFDTVPQDYPLNAEKTVQREMLLSLCLEQRWANFLIRCATEWSDGSAAYIYPEFLRWGVQRASELKLIADRLCVPLFDQSGTNIGETEVKTLRFCGQQLECLTTVVSKLPNLETDLQKQRRALRRIATYLQVLLWFYDVGLLPESQEMEDENDLPQNPLSMKIPYPKDKLVELYKKKRRSGTDNEGKDTLFIDQLMSRECAPLKAQWEREADSECPNPGGYYPPPSLQSLLRSFLCDCYREEFDNINDDEEDDDLPEMKIKHSITIYLLMDLAMLLQRTHPSVDRLIKYPSAFKLSPSLIKLTQAFWLLDHDDYDGFFKILTGELILPSDIKDWQHKFAVDSLLRNDQHKLALMYLRVLKPPLSTLEDQGTIIGLSVEQGLVESAFHARPPGHYTQLLTKFFQSCKANGKLKQILYLSLDTEEEEAFIRFLKENDCDDIKLLYYLQRCRHTEASDVFSMENTNLNSRHSTVTNRIHPVAQRLLSAFNATLPEVTKKFARNSKQSSDALANRIANQQSEQGSVLSNGLRGYPRPFSQFRNPVKSIYEVAMSKTRETCLKSERCVSGPQYVPFLGAPCSTLVYCTRVSGSALPEPSDTNSILYPEKKKGKRTIGMVHDGEEQTDGVSNSKRPRLGSECDRNYSSGDNNEQSIRRLSMSQVCQTPLVERKMKLMDSKDANHLVTETPHSILKIRQMIRRSTDSPGFGFGSNEREAMMRRNVAGDSRSARQIRFSMDRLSANDDSAFSVTESNQDENECNHSGSSKNTEEESCIESYYSPNVSAKSIRESSILSDSSITKFVRGPRPRPSLRRSSILSRTSSDWQSQKGTSLDTTLEVSDNNMDATQDNVNASTISTYSSSPSLYDASILSCNTTFGRSPMKRPLFFNNQRRAEEETEESEAPTEDEEAVSELHEESVNKDSSIECVASTNSRVKQNDGDNQEMEEDVEEVESQHEEMEDLHEESASKNQGQKGRISEDEDEASKKESELEEGECDQDDDTFQSFSNSTEEEAHESVNFSQRLNESVQNETSFSLMRHSTQRQIVVSDYSLTQNFAFDRSPRKDESYHSGNYSLTRPIFLDNRGILRCSEPVDITDDESNDLDVIARPQLVSVKEDEDQEMKQEQTAHDEKTEEKNQNDEVDLTLNLSPSEGSDEEHLKKSKEEEDLLEKQRRSYLSSERSDETLSLFAKEERSTPTKESSIVSRKEQFVGRRSRLSSTSSTKSENNSEEGTPLRRSARHQSSLTVKVPTPRRSIKSASISPTTKSEEQRDRSKRGSSVTKEVKKILSKVIGEQNIPKINIEEVSSNEEKNTLEKSQESSPVSKTLEIKTTRKTRPSPRPPLRESSEEKTQTTPKKQASPVSIDEKFFMRESQKEESPAPSEKKNRASQSDKDVSAEPLKLRASRAGSIVKETSKSTRKTRAASVLEGTSPTLEVTEDEPAEKKTGKTRATRAATITQDLSATRDLTAIDDQEENREMAKTAKTRSTRASSQAKETATKVTGRRTRTASTAKEDVHEDKSAEVSQRTRAASVSKEDKDVPEEKSAGSGRRMRAASLAKEEEETPAAIGRRTRAASVTQDKEAHVSVGRRTRAASVTQDEEAHVSVGRRTRAASVTQDEEVHTPVGRRTRTTSITQVEEAHTPVGRRTRAASVTQDEETFAAVGRRTRAASVTQDEETFAVVGRRTRAASVTKNEDTSVLSTTRRTRAASQAKETAEEEAKSIKRTTRATSVSKENNEEVQEDTRTTRKRGNSVPKELSSAPEPSRIVPSRSRRSTSLLKEVILEESLSQIDSPVGGKRSRSTCSTAEEAVSSPAANTRSRRSSIQSMPDELEEVPSIRSTRKNSEPNIDESRSRRAASVDSSAVTAPAGKRMTRSVLAKTTIIDEVIPEEAVVTKSPSAKKQPTRRKRATSVPVDHPEEPEKPEKNKEKIKPAAASKSKKGRTIGEKFLFSLPEEAGQEDVDGKDDNSRSPTFKFSKPTMLQKFISPVYFDEESSDKTANALRHIRVEERVTSAGGVRRPRTCFVLAEKRKTKRSEQ